MCSGEVRDWTLDLGMHKAEWPREYRGICVSGNVCMHMVCMCQSSVVRILDQPACVRRKCMQSIATWIFFCLQMSKHFGRFSSFSAIVYE